MEIGDILEKICELWKEACFYGRPVDLKAELEKLYYDTRDFVLNPTCELCPFEQCLNKNDEENDICEECIND